MLTTNCDDPKYSFSKPDFDPKTFRCHIALIRDESEWSCIILNLPGAAGCGESETEAIESAKESVLALAEEYASMGMDIPWVTKNYDKDIPENAILKWIIVDG